MNNMNDKKKITVPIVMNENAPISNMGVFPLEEGEFKEHLKELYPAPWTEEAKRYIKPLVALDNTPLNELKGDKIPDKYSEKFYTKLYGEEAEMYYKGMKDARDAEAAPDNSKVLNNHVTEIIPCSEKALVQNNYNMNYGHPYAPAAMPIVTPYVANRFSQQDNNDADTADNIRNILNGRYICTEQNKLYYMWNGCIWEEKNYMEFKRAVVDIVQNRYKYVRENKINVDMNYIRNGCNDSKITDIINIINVKIYVSESLLNNDKGLLCVKNGIYDTNEQCMYPHSKFKDRYITRMINVLYDPNAMKASQIFRAFVMDIISDNIAMADFLQRAFGYALIGKPIEQKCIMLVGTGANGKTTLIEAIANLLGKNYCTFVSKKLFMSEDNGNVNNATPAIMQLKGKRMVFSSELKRNDKIAEAQFKKIIGGGKLVGRGLYKGMTEFDNESTVFIDTNHLPSVETAGSSAGYAIFRRIEIIPFNRQFDEAERNIDLPDLLKSELVQKEILGWLIEGSIKYHKNRLTPTDDMQKAKYEYIQKENSVARFFECCVYQSGFDNDFVSSSLLYNSYLNYCKQNGLSYIGKTQFYKSEKVLMLDHFRTAKERGYKGVRLVNRKLDI